MRRPLGLLFILSLFTLGFVACSKSGGGGGDSSTATAVGQCSVGQYISSRDGSCLNPSPNCPGQGYDPTINSCVPGTYVSTNYYNTAGGSQDVRFENALTVTNSTVFKQLLTDYGNGCGWTWLIGGPDYSYLMQQSYAEVRVNTVTDTTARVTIGLGATAPDAYYPPSAIIATQGQVWAINGSSTPGIEIQANGSANTCTWNAVGNMGLVVEVDHQTFTSQYMDAIFSYKGSQFARARLISY